MGRRPEPGAVKAQKAAVRSTREPKPELLAAAEIGAVKAPAWLKADALKIWARLAPVLTPAKLLSPADAETFGRYCRNFARWLKMQAALDKGTETYTIKSASGIVHRPRPEFLIADRLERQLLAAEDRFGLNPAERQRIMAARAQSGVSGDLFAAPDQADGKRPGDPAATPAAPAKPASNPVGLLN